MPELPAGTVTFMFTDLVGSTRSWEAHPDSMSGALARHDAIVRDAIESSGGVVVKARGDGFHAAFSNADVAITAAVVAQRAIAAEDWGEPGELRVRMGLHTGSAELRDGDYYGTALNRAARLEAIAHGGQIVCSQATADLARDSLGDEITLVSLGEHRLRDLSRPELVFQVRAPGIADDFPPLLSLGAFLGNLPLQLTSLIGREQEIARAAEGLQASRVVTLTGVGGVGKTRLALQVAADLLPNFRYGAWLCELAPVRTAEGVGEAVASVFDVAERSGQTTEQALVVFLRHKELLLVLDNCEHVLEEAAELVEAIEHSCPQVRVLATSREGLGVEGELILAVPSLGAPRPDLGAAEIRSSDAVRLFTERARALKADFEVTPENAADVAEVCRRLDGMPLAIELAAARVPAMNPRELAERLDQRFQLLTGTRRGKVERHQTLRAVIDWSYDLLGEAEQCLLDRMTVFTGGWTLAAAESVCAGGVVDPGAVFALTERLVARSLVNAEDHGFQTRYRLLETIRQYGEERLLGRGEGVEIRVRHGEYYLQFAADISARVFGPDQILCGELLAADTENLDAAATFAIDRDDTDTAYRWLRAMPGPRAQLGHQARLPIEAMLALPGARDHPDYAYALSVASVHAGLRGDRAVSERRLEELRDIEHERGEPLDVDVRIMVTGAKNANAFGSGAFADAARLAVENVELWRSLGRAGELAYFLAGAAALQAAAGDVEAALALATEGLALARAIGMPVAISMNLAALASALAEQEPEHARALLRESIELRESLGYETANEVSEGVLVAARVRDWPTALELAARAIPLLHWNADRPQLAGALNVTARAIVDRDPDTAASLQGAARRIALAALGADGPREAAAEAPLTVPRAVGFSIVGAVRHETTGLIDEALGRERRRALQAEGETLDDDHTVTLALDAIARGRRASPD